MHLSIEMLSFLAFHNYFFFFFSILEYVLSEVFSHALNQKYAITPKLKWVLFLYSEGFYWGFCSYINYLIVSNILLLFIL